MKTTKIFFATLLVLLCTATIGQQNSSLFAAVKFSPEMNRVETWVYQHYDRNSEELLARDAHPNISQTFYTDYTEITYEEAVFEIGPHMEDWMSEPFETEAGEENLTIEPWMTKPFETEAFIPIEDWMTAASW